MNFETTSDTIYCRFEGAVNTTICTEVSPVLAEHIDAALTQHSEINVIFDLQNAQYVCSAFLRLCVLYYKKVGRERFRVENASEEVRNIFDIAGLTNLLR